MKDKHKIELTLRIFKAGHMTEEDAVKGLLEIHNSGKRFNYANFILGMFVGMMYLIFMQNLTK